MKSFLPSHAFSRAFWIVLVIALQFFALLSIALKREWVHAYGERVYLRTAPVDPRDIFRGDYVDLEYDIAFPHRDVLPEDFNINLAYQRVFVTLGKNADGVAEARNVTNIQPSDRLYIKGHMGSQVWRNWTRRGQIKYGIERYFIEQNTGRAIEEKRGSRDQWQTAMEVEAAIGRDGTAVIRGHRWSQIAIRLEVIEAASNRNDRANSEERRSPHLQISLRNDGDSAIGVPDNPAHCAFRLFDVENTSNTSRGGMTPLEFANRRCHDTTDFTVHALSPGEVYSADFDLAEPSWHVVYKNRAIELADLPNSGMGFRFVFVPIATPETIDNEQLPIPKSSIRSASFNSFGRID